MVYVAIPIQVFPHPQHFKLSKLPSMEGKGHAIQAAKGQGKSYAVEAVKGQGQGHAIEAVKGQAKSIDAAKGQGKGHGIEAVKGQGKGLQGAKGKGKGKGIEGAKGHGKGIEAARGRIRLRQDDGSEVRVPHSVKQACLAFRIAQGEDIDSEYSWDGDSSSDEGIFARTLG